MNLTLKSYIEWVDAGTFSPDEVVQEYLKKAKESNDKYFSYLRFHEDYVKTNLNEFKSKLLRAAPIAIKDIILTKWYITSFGSKMWKNYVSPYSATSFENLEKNGGLMIWKTNMDEFAMGTTTEWSAFGVTKNFHGIDRIPWWSSGGSAVAVAGDLCLWALGTDTGGSVRQPASMCGVVGFKPTYARVSRYGVQSLCNSFDQVGVFAKNIEDSKILLSAIAGYDPKDATSIDKQDFKSRDSIFESDIPKYKIALPKQALGDWLDPRIKDALMKKVKQLRNRWFEVDEVDMSLLDQWVAMYYTLMPAEMSTNLSRFDGIRFGKQDDMMKFDSVADYYKKIRSEWFGEEVKRRIMIGTYVLSSANYKWFYLKAQQIRKQLIADTKKIFEKYDLILTPTSPELAWKLWAKIDDPLKMYLADIYTVSANIVWIPAVSLPGWLIDDNWEKMPWGIQFMADKWKESKLFGIWKIIEEIVAW